MAEDTRFVAVPHSRLTAVLDIAKDWVTTIILGSVGASLLSVVVMLAVDDQAIRTPDSWDELDGFSRSLLGFAGLIGGFGMALFLLVPLWVAVAFSLHRDLVRFMESNPHTVPLAQQRAIAESRYQRLSVTAYSTIIGTCTISGILLILIVADAVKGSSSNITSSATGLAILTPITVVAVWVAVKAKTSSWAAPRAPFLNTVTRQRAEREAQRAAKRQNESSADTRPDSPVAARQLLVTGIILMLAAVVATTLLVVMRQQCRRCRPRTFGPNLEWLIDQGFLLATVATITSVLLLTAAIAIFCWDLDRRRTQLLGLAGGNDPGTHRPSESELRSMVHDVTPLRWVATTAGLWVALAGWSSMASLVEYQRGQPPFADFPHWALALALSCVAAFGLIPLLVIAAREKQEVAEVVVAAWPGVEEMAPARPGRPRKRGRRGSASRNK